MKIFLGIIACFLILNCAGTPLTHFYMLEIPESTSENRSAKYAASIGVERIMADDAYSDDRLIYREDLYEVKYYHYHRWVSMPAKMVTEMVLAKLKQAALFEKVVQLPTGNMPDFMLYGCLKSFEEWDEAQQWYGKVRLEFILEKTENKQILLQKEFSARIQVEKHEPIAVVKALNQSTGKCLDELMLEIERVIH